MSRTAHFGRETALVVAVALVAAAMTLAGCGASKKKVVRAPASGVTSAQLTSLSTSLGHPIYWAGPRAGMTYELSRTADGRVYIRYLPAGVKVGDSRPNFLSIGTYPQKNALSVLESAASKEGVTPTRLPGGGLAYSSKSHPTSVYVAYPASPYEIEVYDPAKGAAHQLVVSGKIVPLGIAANGHAGPTAASAAQLKTLAASIGHPIYWAGAVHADTYELSRTSDGRVYIRYLPAGVKVGDPRPNFLTVGTYPQANAYALLKATAAKSHATTIKLPGGGIASIQTSKPTSVYVAYPGENLEIEIFDPSASLARSVVTGGRIVRIR